jgi:preprotein translocase subunit SecG
MLFFIPAAIFALLGWLIRHKKVEWLITGYRRPSKDLKREEDILRRSLAMGNFMFFLASLFLVMAVVNGAALPFADTVTLVGLGIISITVLIGVIALSTGSDIGSGKDIGSHRDRKR